LNNSYYIGLEAIFISSQLFQCSVKDHTGFTFWKCQNTPSFNKGFQMEIAATSSFAQQSLRFDEAAVNVESGEDENSDKVEDRATSAEVPPAQRAAAEEQGPAIQAVNGVNQTGGQVVENGAIGVQLDIRV
jgi:hypothetical protein